MDKNKKFTVYNVLTSSKKSREMSVQEFIDWSGLDNFEKNWSDADDILALTLAELFCRYCIPDCFGGDYQKRDLATGAGLSKGRMAINFWKQACFYEMNIVFDGAELEWHFFIWNIQRSEDAFKKPLAGGLQVSSHLCDSDWLVLVKKSINLLALAFGLEQPFSEVTILQDSREWLILGKMEGKS